MWLTSKTVRAVLRDRKLRKHLLSNSDLSETDYLSFDSLDEDKRDIASENVIDVLEAFAPLTLIYSSPFEHLPNDAEVYGTRGIYMVITQEDREFFSKKTDAIRSAEAASKVSWEISEQEGLVKIGI